MNIFPEVSYENGWIDGYLKSDGSIGYDVNGDMTSPFVAISAGLYFTVSVSYSLPSPHPGWMAVCYYNSSKSKIGSRIITEAARSAVPASISATTPAGTAFIRATSSNLTDGQDVSMSCDVIAWYIDSDGNLTNDHLPAVLPKMTPPLPASVWRIQSGYADGFPFNAIMPGISIQSGAFENSENLRRIVIPESVKQIGDTAFQGTALKRVRIASDCAIGDNSFPEDCIIMRYPPDTHGQLVDGSERVVLDRQGRRIYIRRNENG